MRVPPDVEKLDEFLESTPLQQGSNVEECLINAFLYEYKNELEAAYKWYLKAADMDSASAMRCIGNLYFHKKFHSDTASGMESMLFNEMADRTSIFTHNIDSEAPDYKAAFEWYLKAAEHGDTDSMNDVGIMYYNGAGGKKDTALAKLWLKKAVDNNNKYAIYAYHNLFGEIEISYKSDEEYLDLLKEFEKCANAGLDTRCFDLYRDLIVGTEKQLAKLGYVLAKGKYSVGGIYEKFDYPRRQSGEPYAPVYLYSRYDWVSLLKVNLDCFDEESPRLGFSNDIYSLPKPIKWLEECGKMTYMSGDFGWLGEIKDCSVMKVNKNLAYDTELLESMSLDSEYKSKLHQSNDAIFTEDGEKEYSVEICQITKDNEIVILCRYTMDGGDQGDRPSKAVPVKVEGPGES